MVSIHTYAFVALVCTVISLLCLVVCVVAVAMGDKVFSNAAHGILVIIMTIIGGVSVGIIICWTFNVLHLW